MADTAKPGWYPDPDRPGRVRRWDGEEWTDRSISEQDHAARSADGADPAAFWIFGFILSAIGAAIGIAGESDVVLLGILLGAVGWVLLMVAIVATGVSIGMRHRDALLRRKDLD